MRKSFVQKVYHPSRQEQRGRGGGQLGLVAAIERWFARDLWTLKLEELPRLKRWGLRALRVGALAVRGFVQDRCLFRASGLTYITVLSIVPLLAFSFSVAKGFGAYDLLRSRVIEPWIDQVLPVHLAPAASGSGAPEIAVPELPEGGSEVAEDAADEPRPPGTTTTARAAVDRVLELVERTDFSRLGFFGLAILLYTVVKLLDAAELALNDIWGIRRGRSIVRKVADYVTLIVVTPIFLIAGIGLFTLSQTERALEWLRGALGLGLPLDLLLATMPYFVIWIGLTILYVTLPNTRVRLSSALWGGAVGGLFTLAALFGHNRFQVGIARFDAIYAGFAAFPIFLVFIYFLWTTLLFGAEVAAAHQGHHAFRRLMLGSARDEAERERLALRALARITAAFLGQRGSAHCADLAIELEAPESDVEDVLDQLVQVGILAEVEGPSGELRWICAQDPGGVSVADVLEAMRGESSNGRAKSAQPATGPLDPRVDRALSSVARAAHTAPENWSLRELVLKQAEPDDDGAS